jgi:hypothetical protein
MAGITITINRDATPVLVTGDPAIVEAVLDALERVLRGPERRVLRLARDQESPPAGGAA